MKGRPFTPPDNPRRGFDSRIHQDEEGNYTGKHPTISASMRHVFKEKVPMCPYCGVTFLYSYKARERGMCALCARATGRMRQEWLEVQSQRIHPLSVSKKAERVRQELEALNGED